MTRLTHHQCAVLTAFTGILVGRFSDFHKYAETVMDRPVFTHEFASEKVWDQLKDLSREDLVAMLPEDLLDELVARSAEAAS